MADPKLSFIIETVPTSLAGAATLRIIESSAIEESLLSPLMWPRQPTQEESESSVRDTSTQLDNTAEGEAQSAEDDARTLSFLQDPSNHYRLATDAATNTPVAFVWWQFCKGQTEAQWAEKYTNRWRSDRMNKALADATGGARFLKRAKLLGDEDFLMLKELYVRLEFQRRGIGGALVEWGVKKADELRLVAYTEATPEGLGLYLKHGFEEFDRVTVDLEPWGGKKGTVNSYGLLLRKPKAGEYKSTVTM